MTHSNGESLTIIVDVRGEICPGPLIAVTEAMGRATVGQGIELLTDFAPAVLTVTSAAIRAGWDINVRQVEEKEWRLLLVRSDISFPSL